MAIGKVVFTKGQGGSGRPLTGKDHISGFIGYLPDGSLPSGWKTTEREKKLLSITDAKDAGLVLNYADGTSASGTVTSTGVGSAGDVIKITSPEILGAVTIAQYTVASGDTTVTLLAASIVAHINAKTYLHGYSASNVAGVITVVAPKKQGVFLNTKSLTVAVTGTATATTGAFTGGLASRTAQMYYHVSEFFRMHPQGVLYVGFYAAPTALYAEVKTLCDFANGDIRQIAVFDEQTVYTSAKLTLIHNAVLTCDTAEKPLSALYTANIVSFTDVSTLPDLNALSANKVTCIIGQDGAAQGYEMFKATGKTVSNIGAFLGALSLSRVSASFAEVGKFNFSNTIENEVVAFGNGQMLSVLSDNKIDAVDDYRYVFTIKRTGYEGTFANNNYTAIAGTSDYAFINDNRVIDKAIRLARTGLIPLLSSEIIFNADGTMTDITVAIFEDAIKDQVGQMLTAQEISGLEVTIDPSQNVASTSNLEVAMTIKQNGIARSISVKIGFKI